MKLHIFFFTFALFTAIQTVNADSTGTEREDPASTEISAQEEMTILQGLKNKCTELNMCNQKFDVSFNHIKCLFTAKSCELKYELFLKESPDSPQTDLVRIPFKCVSQDFFQKEDVIRDNIPTERLYQTFSNCILSIQKSIDF